ncbi:uncharacterized protein LOC123564425 [Mercenaria mercenaria]|uniref:uncharacterized protein LOC123564425 n=1 Tax=Mercenaria mercenaria TaxID=6596 RepID=UPI00234E4D85|nr:uncharacterized protein LOC123564425 [Mercenaria mercenaria]XP_053393029.1 uncharacterized protein LOC123564425 [Mercenaria mercenaria]
MPETSEKCKEAQGENEYLRKYLQTQENKFDSLKLKVEEESRKMRRGLSHAQRQVEIEMEEKRAAVERQQNLEERLQHVRRRCEEHEKRINHSETEPLYNMGNEP